MQIHIHHYHHDGTEKEAIALLYRLVSKVHQLEIQIMALSPQVQALVDKVAANTNAVQSALAGFKAEQTQIAALQSQIATLQPGQPIDAEDLAAITKAVDDLGATNTALQTAVPAAVPNP